MDKDKKQLHNNLTDLSETLLMNKTKIMYQFFFVTVSCTLD